VPLGELIGACNCTMNEKQKLPPESANTLKNFEIDIL